MSDSVVENICARSWISQAKFTEKVIFIQRCCRELSVHLQEGHSVLTGPQIVL